MAVVKSTSLAIAMRYAFSDVGDALQIISDGSEMKRNVVLLTSPLPTRAVAHILSPEAKDFKIRYVPRHGQEADRRFRESGRLGGCSYGGLPSFHVEPGCGPHICLAHVLAQEEEYPWVETRHLFFDRSVLQMRSRIDQFFVSMFRGQALE